MVTVIPLLQKILTSIGVLLKRSGPFGSPLKSRSVVKLESKDSLGLGLGGLNRRGFTDEGTKLFYLQITRLDDLNSH